ncbi:ABC transporter ATP-binding protein [Virgibacillus byunsanensis]|uniref:ABC transporter ATP-binding protein n=1 Tax=Virgibacillus byunsanensis TaxID=570945 RepID=A0ABW3LQ00_9BACI
MIKIENATQMYHSNIIFEQVNFTIDRGERVAIVGRNGAGKTTLLHALVGFSRLKEGKISIDGKAVHQPAAWKGKLSYLPEKFQLYLQLSVVENVQYVADTLRIPKKEVEAVLRHTNMWDYKDKRISQVSKGMLQRVGLSVALLGKPEWVVLDEPTSGLDPFGRNDILKIMENIGTSNRSLLFTTHHMNEVNKIATHVLYLHDKKIIKLDANTFLEQFERSISS